MQLSVREVCRTERFRAGRVGTDRSTDAVEGVPAVVEAARAHRIDTPLLRPDGPGLGREVWAGTEPDQVAVRRSDVQTLGESDPISVRADDALLRSAAITGADVLLVPHALPDEPSLSDDADREATEAADGAGGTADTDLPAGGIGALLRWTY